MKFFNSYLQAKKKLESFNSRNKEKNVAVCIGNFDGMHLGHQQLFKAVDAGGDDFKLFLTFRPHPKKILNDLGADFKEITPLRQKAKIAKKYGFDAFLALKFSSYLRSLSAEEFVKEILVDSLNAKTIVVGYDWRFGNDREGNLDFLRKLSLKYKFSVIGVEKFLLNNIRVSSSLVRKALNEGNLDLANKFLNRNFSVGFKVVKGDQRGRQLGFPTANMQPKGQLLPAMGVYATKSYVDGLEYRSVSNIGVRPTFEGGKQVVLETHILDNDKINLYGKCMEVEFVERIRKEKKFNSASELIEQIKLDCSEAKSILSS